jgi:hypothetical protein
VRGCEGAIKDARSSSPSSPALLPYGEKGDSLIIEKCHHNDGEVKDDKTEKSPDKAKDKRNRYNS